MKAREIAHQLVPPHDHRRNPAERAIRTSKNHFIAGMSSCDPDCPMSTWDYMLPQSELTLNLVRGSRINPKLSAWEQLKGRYDFNKVPIAPPGTKILAHVRPSARRTWKAHALEAWYMGPAFEHYRCYTAYVPSTGKTRIVDTVSWFPKKVAMPIATKEDLMRAALEDLTNAIKDPEQGTLAGNLPPSATEHLKELTDLKYTNTSFSKDFNDELFTVKLRYKKPDGATSIAMEFTQRNKTTKADDNMQFAAAIAMFGMQLRHSKYDNSTTLDDVVKLAKNGKGTDEDGYRAEFIRLVESYKEYETQGPSYSNN